MDCSLPGSTIHGIFQARILEWVAISKKGNAKECSNYHTIALISLASKVMLKIPKPGFNSLWTMNFQMVKLDLEKAEEPEMKLPTSAGSLKKARVPEKHVLLINWLCQSLCVDHNKLWKILERWEYQTSWPASWEIRMYVKTQQLEPDMEQQTGSKLGKEYIKAVYCHCAYLTYMQSTSCEMPS